MHNTLSKKNESVDNGSQLDIFTAIEAGNQAMEACFDKASKLDPEFKEKAEKAILSHLAIVRQASGETLTEIAKAHGAVPHSDRAFGAIYKGLARRGLIINSGFVPRAKGHGAPGILWGIA